MNKKSITVVNIVEPAFYREFSCAGGECPDHCCHSWGVSVNKQAYKKLKKHKDVIVRQFANENFSLKRNNESAWAYIKMDEQGNCPALDENGWCELHKRCGHSQLPHTCQDYPRSANWFGDYVEASLFLSCPSAAENILFNPESMMFEERQEQLKNINNGNTSGMIDDMLPNWLPTLRSFCFILILDEDVEFNERIFNLGLFLKQAENHLDDLTRLEQFIHSFTELYNEGKMKKMFVNLPLVETLKWQVFSYQDKQLVIDTMLYSGCGETGGLTSTSIRFQQCRDQMLMLMMNQGQAKEKSGEVDNTAPMENFGDKEGIEGSSELFEQILTQANTEYLDEYFKKNPQLLTNYALYYLYHFQFLVTEGKSLFEFFRIMVVDLLMLKSYLSAIAVNQKGLTDEWFIKTVQSYSRRRQHNNDFVARLEKQLKDSGTDSAGAIFGLLK